MIKRLLIIPFLLASCTTELSTYDKLLKIFNEYQVDLDISKAGIIIIIPMDGCQPCIEKTQNFAKENIDNENILFIASGVGRKIISYNFSESQRNRKNFIQDYKDLSHEYDLITTGPVVFFYDNETIINEIMIDLNTNTKKLFSYIIDYSRSN
jgi:hypothetical protein